MDKSHYVAMLAEHAGYYFLSRPRRFGKSLFVDTLKCAFEGQEELFQGLYLENNWDWNDSWPVLSISLGRRMVSDLEELNTRILSILDELARYYETAILILELFL